MDLLHVKAIKIVAAGGDLDAAVAMEVVDETVNVQMKEEIVEHKVSTNPNPKERISRGDIYGLSALLAAATYSDLVTVFGGSFATNQYTKPQTQGIKPRWDTRLHVFRPSDGLETLYTWTNMNFLNDLTLPLETAKKVYLPANLVSCDDTAFDIDDTAT